MTDRNLRLCVIPLFFLSGSAALVYQVLWVRELGLLFGSTAQAVAITISIFFSGLAAGEWYWGERARRTRSPLLCFGLIEIGVSIAALAYFAPNLVYHELYPILYSAFEHSRVLDTLSRAIIAFLLLFPAAFLMGGTLPMMGQFLIEDRDALGRIGAALYSVNTLGSACGALAAGFLLPVFFGMTGAYLLAVGIDLSVGVTAVILAVRVRSTKLKKPIAPVEPVEQRRTCSSTIETDTSTRTASGDRTTIRIVAFASGFITLGIEVLWTRLFVQVLQNSVYTYSIILTVFLLGLATGAALSSWLSARIRRDRLMLGALLVLAAVATAGSPWLFLRVTDGVRYIGASLGWTQYVLAVGAAAFSVLFIPTVILGSVLPFLLHMTKGEGLSAGTTLGRLVSIDTVGAILGSLVAGFVLLPALGVFRSLLFLSSLYLLLIGVLLARSTPSSARNAGRGVAFAALLCAAMVATGLLPSWLHPSASFGARESETLIEGIEDSHATASVVKTSGGNRAIRVNNFYTLGSTGALHSERNQAVLPILIHENPRSLFFLGLGTGISAGAAIPITVERITACEILPEVVSLSRRHFSRWTYGLFEDDRATVFAEDGRNCLARSRERYDIIVSDLFTPWKQGTGNLYTVEHFRTASRRLNDGGIYVQWIPLYQVSEFELSVIGRTMGKVFEQLLMWRGDLYPSRSIVALVGYNESRPLDIDALNSNAAELLDLSEWTAWAPTKILPHYVGNVSSGDAFGEAPLNSDNRPVIEYAAPRTHRREAIGEVRFLTGNDRELMYQQVRELLPADRDPYLAQLDERGVRAVASGHALSRYRYFAATGRGRAAEPHRREFFDLTDFETTDLLSPAQLLYDR